METQEVNLQETIQYFFQLLKEFQPEDFWFSRARRFSLYFHKNLKFGHQLHHGSVHNGNTLKDIEQAYENYFTRNPQEIYKKY